jgi:hypothetical protein
MCVGSGSEGDVVAGFIILGVFLLGVREAVDVEGEVVVEAKELLARVEVHVKVQGGRLALGPRLAAEEVRVEDVEGGRHSVNAGGECGESSQRRSILQLVAGAGVEGHDVRSLLWVWGGGSWSGGREKIGGARSMGHLRG